MDNWARACFLLVVIWPTTSRPSALRLSSMLQIASQSRFTTASSLGNAIESLNARYRRSVRARGHFPTEQTALKCPYFVTRSLDPNGHGQTRWALRWKPALNAFAITFSDRWRRDHRADASSPGL